MSDAENRPLGGRMAELVEVMRRLLAPGGCPWDREQTLDSLTPYLLEETYEVLDALEAGSPAEHCEELGDLLLQVVFQAALRQAEGAFDIDDVIAGIVDKLVRRHPHVFADASARTADEVHAQWHEIKARERQDKGEERQGPGRTMAGVPRALPALARAQKLTERAARVGFDATDPGPYWRKLGEEVEELEQAAASGDPAAVEAELGDVLFTVVNLARKLGCDAESALRAANRRFSDRFAYIEDRLDQQGKTPDQASLEEMDALWQQAKGSS